jgi:hypothetical protein
VAICTPKAIYMMDPLKYVCRLLIEDRELITLKVRPICAHKVVLELSNSGHDAYAFQRLLKRAKTKLGLGMSDTPRILELVGKASILGVVIRGNDMLVVYNGQDLSACMFVV